MGKFKYQTTRGYFAQCANGVEPLAAKELQHFGVKHHKIGFRGVFFSTNRETLYRINYGARLVSRVLAPLVSFRCRDRDDLYRMGKSIDWEKLFSIENTFGIFANVSGNRNMTHSNFAALCLKDAVVDYFRNASGKRPNVDKMNPDVWLNLHIEKTRATISFDTSGGSLHRRGYRRESVEAPLQETVAAAIVSLSQWQMEKPLYDPMCGSGTILCEALLKACRIPAGYLKESFGFQHLPDFNERLWGSVKKGMNTQITKLTKGLISGSDLSNQAVKAARANCRMLPGGDSIQIVQKDFNDIDLINNHAILCNPPYGIRLKQPDNLPIFFRNFGDFLKQRCTGSQAFIYFGNREMIKKIGLKPTWKKPLRNAGLDGRLVKYELY